MVVALIALLAKRDLLLYMPKLLLVLWGKVARENVAREELPVASSHVTPNRRSHATGPLVAIVAWLLLLGPEHATAQVSHGRTAEPVNVEVPYRHYSSEAGLPSDFITSLAQSEDGLLWIGTAGGVSTYDGVRFHDVVFPDSVARMDVDDLVAGADSSVWVRLAGRYVAQLRDGRLIRWHPALNDQELPRLLVRGDTLHTVIEHLPDATRWWSLAPEDRSTQPERMVYSESIPTDMRRDVTDFDIGPDGRRWLMTRNGPAWVGRGGRLRFVPLSEPLDLDWDATFRVLSTGDALLWNRETVYWLDLKTGTLRPFFETSLFGDPLEDEGVLYLPADDGVRRWHIRQRRWLPPLDVRTGAPVGSADSVLRDREGGLWIGTREGLVHLYEPEVRHLRRVGGTPLRNVGRFQVDPDGHLWANSYTNGVVRLAPRPALFTPLGETRGIVLYNRQGWPHLTGTNTGLLLRYRSDGEWEPLAPRAGAYTGYVEPSGAGIFYHNEGFFRRDPQPLAAPTPLVEWPYTDHPYTAFTYTSDGDLYVRTRRALLRGRPVTEWDGPWRFDTLAVLDDLHNTRRGALWMTHDSERDQLWLSLADGLLRVELSGAQASGARATWHRVLPGRLVETAHLVGDSLLLAPTPDGLYFLNADNGRLRRRLTEADGLLASYSIEGLVHRDTLYVGHPTGVTMLPLSTVYRTFSPPAARIAAVDQGNRTVPSHTEAAFALGERRVGFSFAPLHFTHPERVRYEHRMVPGDEAWRSSPRPFAEYTNLNPGRHQFELRARLEGRPPGPVASYSFDIPPFFYETGWFRVGCLLAVGVIIAAASYLRVHRLKRRERELAALVAIRTRELEAEKRKTEAQARHLVELDEAKSRFFANISHEFRTPLTLILGSAESAFDGRYGPLAEAFEKPLGRIRHQAHHLLRLVEQLLDLSRIEHGRLTLHPRRQDLVDLARRLTRSFAPLAERRGLRLTFRSEEPRLPVSFDPDHVEKAVSNLLSNALKFTPDGGKVFVSVDRRDLVEAHWAEVAVRDTGPGIRREDLERIFDRFEQIDGAATRRHEGTGIGLALAKELVELHGGKLLVESEPGYGSSFYVRLPLSGTEEQNARADVDATSPVRRTRPGPAEPSETEPGEVVADRAALAGDADGPGTPAVTGDGDGLARPLVLVVEDNAEVRAYLRELLAPRYRVLEAEDGAEGLAVARAEQPDLVLSDVMMPGTDGLALLDAFRADEQLRETPVLLLTARAAEADRVEGLTRGADGYLVKPFSAGELKARVGRLIQTRRVLQERYRKELRVEPAGVVVASDEEAFLRRVLEAAEAHLSESGFGAEALAEHVGVSRRQLTRKLKAVAGEPPSDILRRLRLERAAQLLEAGAGTVAEVAYAVGFKSASHFSRAFGKHFGCTPSEYGESEHGESEHGGGKA